MTTDVALSQPSYCSGDLPARLGSLHGQGIIRGHDIQPGGHLRLVPLALE